MKQTLFDVSIGESEQKLFFSLLVKYAGTDYKNLPDEYKSIINEIEFRNLVDKLVNSDSPEPRFNKMFVLVDYINAFVSGSLGSDAARSIEDNVAERLKMALEEERTAVVVLIDSHYNKDTYMNSREGRHLPILHAYTDEERMIYGKVGELLSSFYSNETEDYDSNEEEGVYFIHKSTFGTLDAVDIIDQNSSQLVDKALEFEREVMESNLVGEMEMIAEKNGRELEYSWDEPLRSVMNNLVMMESDVEEIELAGVATNICVLSNAVVFQTCLPEAEIYVHANCVASYDEDLHEKALDIMNGLGINVVR